MNKSNPRTVLKKIVLVSYTLSMIVFSCIVMGFSKDFAIIYCSATLASVCTFFYKTLIPQHYSLTLFISA